MELIPNGEQQFSYANGNPLANGTVGFYIPNTLTPKATYTTQAGNVQNSNPVNLDGNGRAVIWGSGTYRQIVKDSNGNTIWDEISSCDAAGALQQSLASSTGSSLIGGGTQVVASIAALRGLLKTSASLNALVTGYYTPGDGGGGNYWYNAADVSSADNGGTIIVANDGGRWYLSDVEQVTVKQFGAKGDGTTNDATALQNAVNAITTTLLAPPATYAYSSTLSLTNNNFRLLGSGRANTVFKFTGSTSSAAITVSNSLSNVFLEGFTVDRTGTAVSGGDGISWTGSCSHASIKDISVIHQHHGFSLGVTDFSLIEDCFSGLNQGDGFHWENGGTAGAFQWQLDTLLSYNNGNNGYFYFATGSAGSVSMGTAININSYANSGHGYSVSGASGAPVSGIRVYDSFFGQDGASEFSVDSYGNEHLVSNCFVELAGTGLTGPLGSTAASNVGSGFVFTANNGPVSIIGGCADGNSQYGLITGAATMDVTGAMFLDSGSAGGDPNVAGINHIAGYLNVCGGRSGNRGASTFTKVGVLSFDGSKLALTGLDLSTPATSALAFTTNAASAIITGCRGANTQVPAGGVSVGLPTGGAGSTGTINVATSVSLNNTAYTNP